VVATQRTETNDQRADLSALIDGELSDEQAARALERLLADPQAQAQWMAYHAQADAMRFPSASTLHDGDFLDAFRERFATEPVHLPVPRPVTATKHFRAARQWRRTWLRYGMPGAAAAAAVAVVSWMTYPQFNGRNSEAGIVAIGGPQSRASTPVVPQDYLLAHQQYAPSSRFHGVAPYVRTASMVTPVQASNEPRARQ
jgi:sigma-E factor negative regulatory protein RseA